MSLVASDRDGMQSKCYLTPQSRAFHLQSILCIVMSFFSDSILKLNNFVFKSAK